MFSLKLQVVEQASFTPVGAQLNAIHTSLNNAQTEFFNLRGLVFNLTRAKSFTTVRSSG